MLPFRVFSIREESLEIPSTAVPQEIMRSSSTDLGFYTAKAGSGAVIPLLKTNLIRLDNLLKALDSAPVLTGSQTNESKRWFLAWHKEWNRVEKMAESQIAELSPQQQDNDASILKDWDKQKKTASSEEYAWMIINSDNLVKPYQALQQNYRNRAAERFFSVDTASDAVEAFPHSGMREKLSYIFGASEGGLQAVSLQETDSPSLSVLHSVSYWLPWTVFPFLLFVSLKRSYTKDLFLQYPHFFGVSAGLLLWCLFPSALLGKTVLALTFLSFFYPIQTKRTAQKENGA
jgi:hypothetical protein